MMYVVVYLSANLGVALHVNYSSARHAKTVRAKRIRRSGVERSESEDGLVPRAWRLRTIAYFGAYCISPLPNDQSSRPESTRLIQTSSFLTCARSWISSAIRRKKLFLTSSDLPPTQVT
jgi:hypothetical protein